MYHVLQCITLKYRTVPLILTWSQHIVYQLHYIMYVFVESNSAQCLWLCSRWSAAVPNSYHTVNTALLFYTVSSRICQLPHRQYDPPVLHGQQPYLLASTPSVRPSCSTRSLAVSVAATPSIRPSCYTRSVAVSISFHTVGTALLFYKVISRIYQLPYRQYGLPVIHGHQPYLSASTPSVWPSCSTRSLAVSVAVIPSIRPSCYTRSLAVSISFHTVGTALLFYKVISRISSCHTVNTAFLLYTVISRIYQLPHRRYGPPVLQGHQPYQQLPLLVIHLTLFCKFDAITAKVLQVPDILIEIPYGRHLLTRAKLDMLAACCLHLLLLAESNGRERSLLLFHCLLYFSVSFMCICRQKPLSRPCLHLDNPSILLPPSLTDTTLNLPFHPPISLRIPLVNILLFLLIFLLSEMIRWMLE